MLRGRGKELESGCKHKLAKRLHKMKGRGGFERGRNRWL
jgi:hypothetical protein